MPKDSYPKLCPHVWRNDGRHHRRKPHVCTRAQRHPGKHVCGLCQQVR